MTIVATVGGSDSNSYVTMDEADSYMENNPYGQAWGSDDATLLYAAIMLDSLADWNGSKTSSSQAREFPRVGLETLRTRSSETYDYGMSFLGADPLSSVIPQEIKNAQCELALYLQNTPASPIPTGTNINIIEVGPIKLDMNGFKAGQIDLLPPLIQGMIAKYGRVRRSGASLLSSKTSR